MEGRVILSCSPVGLIHSLVVVITASFGNLIKQLKLLSEHMTVCSVAFSSYPSRTYTNLSLSVNSGMMDAAESDAVF